MTKSTRAGVALLLVSAGLAGCGKHGSPSAPSALGAPSVHQPGGQPTPIQPSVTTIDPRVGSTRGGGWATITGADFQPGATVRLDGIAVTDLVRDSTTIAIWTTAHAPGNVDVVVTNPGGLESRLTGGYSYDPPDSFDFNGDWVAHAGFDYEIDMRFSIRNNVLVSVSCGASGPVTLSAPLSIRNGEFSFRSEDGLVIAGTLVSPVSAVGTIDVPACPAAPWWADKNSG